MKKNIVIIIMALIILILTIKLLNPAVVTERKTTTRDNSINSIPAQSAADYTEKRDFNEDIIFRVKDNNPQSADNKIIPPPPSKIQKPESNNYHEFNNTYDVPRSIPPQTGNKQTFNPMPPSEQKETVPRQKVDRNNNLENQFQTCKPYSENMSSVYMGMKVDYKISIEGWKNNKCILNFAANIGSGESSGLSIFSFAPKVRCEFTKDQLLYVGDSILQEEERKKGAKNNMLKKPENVDLNKVTFSDAKLLQVIFTDKACKIINAEDLTKIFDNLF